MTRLQSTFQQYLLLSNVYMYIFQIYIYCSFRFDNGATDDLQTICKQYGISGIIDRMHYDTPYYKIPVKVKYQPNSLYIVRQHNISWQQYLHSEPNYYHDIENNVFNTYTSVLSDFINWRLNYVTLTRCIFSEIASGQWVVSLCIH